VHTAVDHYFKNHFPLFDPGTGQFSTEFSVRKDTGAAYFTDSKYGKLGSLRFDGYEDVGNGTVCGYDIKTGRRGLTPWRIAQLRQASISYYQGRNNGAKPSQVYILEVRPWR
jgi:hypothetical protein